MSFFRRKSRKNSNTTKPDVNQLSSGTLDGGAKGASGTESAAVAAIPTVVEQDLKDPHGPDGTKKKDKEVSVTRMRKTSKGSAKYTPLQEDSYTEKVPQAASSSGKAASSHAAETRELPMAAQIWLKSVRESEISVRSQDSGYSTQSGQSSRNPSVISRESNISMHSLRQTLSQEIKQRPLQQADNCVDKNPHGNFQVRTVKPISSDSCENGSDSSPSNSRCSTVSNKSSGSDPEETSTKIPSTPSGQDTKAHQKPPARLPDYENVEIKCAPTDDKSTYVEAMPNYTQNQDSTKKQNPVSDDEDTLPKSSLDDFPIYENVTNEKPTHGKLSATGYTASPQPKTLTRAHSIYNSLIDVPLDISDFNKQAIAHCLRLMKLGHHAQTFLKRNIDGHLLKFMSKESFLEMGFAHVEADTVIGFVGGWRSDIEEGVYDVPMSNPIPATGATEEGKEAIGYHTDSKTSLCK